MQEALEQLSRWGLSLDDAKAAGLYPVADVRSIYPDMGHGPAIVIPYFAPDGSPRHYRDPQGVERPFARVRWLDPHNAAPAFAKPKARRYDQPPRSGVAAYFPKVLDWVAIGRDVATAIVITEGEAKAIAATRFGIPTIALGGVYSFMTRSAAEMLPELETIAWRDRDVYVVFDSDAATNPNVMAAEGRLADELQRVRGAKLRIVRLPSAEGGGKVGLDDYLMAHGPQAFSNLCRVAPAVNMLDVKILRLNTAVAWIEYEGGIWDLEQKTFLQKANFISGSHHSANKFSTPTQRGVKTVSVAAEWLTHPLAQRFTQVLFRPGQGRTVKCEGGQALNIWEGFKEAEPGNVDPFLRLTAHLFGNMQPDQRDLALKLLAYKARNPQIKIPLAVVMVGPGGAGKSLWGEIVVEAFEAYGRQISADQMVGKFNGWAEKAIVAVVDEAESSVLTENKEKVRAMISQLRMMMEDKFRSIREINSYTLYIINSNKRAVSSYGYDDRRMIVCDIPPKREPEFYATVTNWRAAGGPKWLMHYLLTVDLAGWTPPATAPTSAEKAIAYAEGMSAIERLADDIRHGGGVETVETWITAAQTWATQMELSSNPQVAQQARAITAALPNFQIKPWYTAADLCMMFPILTAQTQGTFRGPPSAGEVSRQLREAGIPYLQCLDNPNGFMVRGRLQQFLVIGGPQWARPLTQADFDLNNKAWPVYSQLHRGNRR